MNSIPSSVVILLPLAERAEQYRAAGHHQQHIVGEECRFARNQPEATAEAFADVFPDFHGAIEISATADEEVLVDLENGTVFAMLFRHVNSRGGDIR